MRVIFTCGGTGGHINPALAVAKLLRARRPDSEILFVGSSGMEKELVPREGFRLEEITVYSYSRGLKPSDFAHNARTIVALRRARRRSRQILREFRPDVVLGTGGYASYPILREATRLHIPTAVHESNAVAGLTTKLVADDVDRILVNFEESRSQYRHPERVVAVGVPVREEFIFTKRDAARRTLGIGDEPLIVSAWGSLGAREMNKKIVDFMKAEAGDGYFRHIHATGSFGWKWMPEYTLEHGLDLSKQPKLSIQEYFYNMPTMVAAADLVLARAGASTLSEIEAAGTPCILIPSPNVTNDHQYKNACVLEARGAAIVIRESECDGEKLYETAKSLLLDSERCRRMRSNLRDMAVLDSAERIYGILCELAQSR